MKHKMFYMMKQYKLLYFPKTMTAKMWSINNYKYVMKNDYKLINMILL